MYRTHTCGELRLQHVGTEVTLAGWVQKVRKLGGMTFIDIRDRYGITQLVVDDSASADIQDITSNLGREFVINATGKVIERTSKNSKIDTGEVEIAISALSVLNKSDLPPFTIEDDTDGGDEIRMKYRYLDLRRNAVRSNMVLRHQIAFETRRYLDQMNFLEVETPILIGSTPEGARDFVVPSRMNPGQFYALPQSPQLFKQLLMVSGFDRYFQIAKCFRDEDLRADRQPEFTQIDCEMSFVEQEDVLQLFEGMMKHLFMYVKNVDFSEPFPRMIRPNGREFNNNIRSKSLSNIFNAFKNVEKVDGICAKNCAHDSSEKIDELTEFVKSPQIGAKELVYIRCKENYTYESSVDGLYSQDNLKKIASRFNAKEGDLILILACTRVKIQKALSKLRDHMVNHLGLRDEDVSFSTPFPRMISPNGKEFENYIRSKSLSDIFNAFKNAENVDGICAKNCALYSSGKIDELTEFVKSPQIGAKGLVYIRCEANGTYKSSVDELYSQDDLKAIASRFNAKEGDLILILASTKIKIQKALFELRNHPALRNEDVSFSNPFPRMTWHDAMKFYGSDKPDIRFEMRFVELKEAVSGRDFVVFDSASYVGGICAEGCAAYTRKQIDELTEFVKRPQIGAKGLVYIRCEANGTYKSSVDKFYSQDDLKAIASKFNAKEGDLILILAGDTVKTQKALCELRLEMGTRLGLRDKNVFKPLWVIDFPLFEWDEDTQRFYAMHHPFTSPKPEDIEYLDSDPGRVRANAYDMVVNGVELGGGSIRIHDSQLQNKMFELLGFTPEMAESQFGFLMNAFKYGAPPHGGLAFGLDRLVSLFAGLDSIRDCIAFPKNNSGRDVMTDAPSTISEEQLKELCLKLTN